MSKIKAENDDEKSITTNELKIGCEGNAPQPPGSPTTQVCKLKVKVEGAKVSNTNTIVAAIIFNGDPPKFSHPTTTNSKAVAVEQLQFDFNWDSLPQTGGATLRLVEIVPGAVDGDRAGDPQIISQGNHPYVEFQLDIIENH